MSEFLFDEYGITEIKLPTLSQVGIKANEYYDSDLSYYKNRRDSGIVSVVVFDEKHHYSTELSQEQLNALNYLAKHQQELLESIYQYTRDVLYPEWIDMIGYEEFLFPELPTIKHLKQVMMLNGLQLYSVSKEEVSYIDAHFDFIPDVEHGVCLSLHKSRILGSAPGHESLYTIDSSLW